jgi:hypothetical protein
MSYICPDIASYLAKTPMDKFERSGRWQPKGQTWSFDYRVAVVLPQDQSDSKTSQAAMLDYLEDAVRWISSLRWSESITSLDVEISYTPLKKRWDWNKSTKIGRCEVNSGETAFYGGLRSRGRREVRVWRAEDWSKVTLHELLHAFGWDRLVGGPHADSGEHQSEALVEAVAVVLHCMLLGSDRAGVLLDIERQWMLNQARALRRRPWSPSGTHVQSYYLLKAALLAVPESYRDFLSWLCSSPDEAAARAAWTDLVSRVRQRLEPLINGKQYQPERVDDASGRMAMHMVRHQLSSMPKRGPFGFGGAARLVNKRETPTTTTTTTTTTIKSNSTKKSTPSAAIGAKRRIGGGGDDSGCRRNVIGDENYLFARRPERATIGRFWMPVTPGSRVRTKSLLFSQVPTVSRG